MEITQTQYQQIEHCMPHQRGNVSHSNLQVSIPFFMLPGMIASGEDCPSALATCISLYSHESLGKVWCSESVFEQLQHQQIIRIRIEAVSLDSTSIKVHPDGTGALKKTAPNPSENLEVDGPPKFIWLPQIPEQS